MESPGASRSQMPLHDIKHNKPTHDTGQAWVEVSCLEVTIKVRDAAITKHGSCVSTDQYWPSLLKSVLVIESVRMLMPLNCPLQIPLDCISNMELGMCCTD